MTADTLLDIARATAGLERAILEARQELQKERAERQRLEARIKELEAERDGSTD